MNFSTATKGKAPDLISFCNGYCKYRSWSYYGSVVSGVHCRKFSGCRKNRDDDRNKHVDVCMRVYETYNREIDLFLKQMELKEENEKKLRSTANEYLKNFEYIFLPTDRFKPRHFLGFVGCPYIHKPDYISQKTTGKTTCEIIKNHHKMLADDPERLSTDFIKSIINKKEDPCPDVND